MATRRGFLRGLGAGLLASGAAARFGGWGQGEAEAATAAGPARPNFVFLLIDDMGWTDLACYGSRFYETPQIDRLASQGMRFTNAYAACTVCSPTRASILTGRYPARLHLTDWIAGHNRPFAKLKIPDWTKYLPLEEKTIADALKPLGYVAGHIGKWHLGGPEYWPEKHGFDSNVGGTAQGQPPTYFDPYKIPTLPDRKAGEYLTDRLGDEACTFLDKNKDRPFFLYFAHYAVHTPLMAKKDLIAKYEAKARPDAPQRNPAYAAMIQSVDECVGRVLAKLDELKLAERTVVIFMSDNGGLIGSTSNLPLRAGKGSLYEGGVREPLIVRWPGVVPAGSTEDAVVSSVDFYPTILQMAGAAQEVAEKGRDGLSIVPLLRRAGALPNRAVYWHYPHYHPGGATPGGIIRQGDFKLIEYFEDSRVELYNLKEDLGEQKDLAAALPDKAAELRTKLADWRRSVGAQMPTPNPDYDPEKDRKPPAKKAKPAPKDGSAWLDLPDELLASGGE